MNKLKHALAGLMILAAILVGCSPGATGTGEQAAADVPAGDRQQPPAEEPPEVAPPVYEWAHDTPENHGVNGALLAELHEALVPTEIYAVVTVKDGVIIDEYYQNGYDEDSVFVLNSCSKSFTGALMGVAIDKGYIDGVDIPISEYFSQVTGTDKADITIRHLLTHTSGIEWYEWNGDARSFWGMNTSDNWVDYVLEQPVIAPPGTTFAYTTGGPHLMAAILQRATGQSVYDFATESLFEPMGMNSVEWRADPQGVVDGGNGISMTARDAAKFGQLYLQNGNWDRAQLISEEWVAQSTQRQSAGSGRSGAYGYQWWLRTFGDEAYDTYYAMGHAGKFIFVVPELDLVTVIVSTYEDNTYAAWPYFTDYILAACQG